MGQHEIIRIIRNSKKGLAMNNPLSPDISKKIADMYHYRNVLRSLITKDLFGNYKNSFLGFGWHFMMPALMMAVYYVVFNNSPLISMPDFWIYLSCALFPFNFMISNLTGSTGIIVDNSGIIKKMFFPREILVIARVISSFIVLLMGYTIVLLLIVLSGHNVSITSLLFTIMGLILIAIFVLGYSFILSSITVYVRDVKHIFQSISVAFFFITPMYFTIDSMDNFFATIIWLNPFTYFIELFHQCIYYNVTPTMEIIAPCIIMSILTITIGFIIFRRLKKGFAERL